MIQEALDSAQCQTRWSSAQLHAAKLVQHSCACEQRLRRLHFLSLHAQQMMRQRQSWVKLVDAKHLCSEEEL
jgi:hypothetical protein